MAERKFLQVGSAAIRIAAAGAAPPADAVPLAPKFVSVLQSLAQTVSAGFQEAGDGRPDEVRVAFHLGVAADGQFVILEGADNANFSVSFTWGGGVPAVKPPKAPYVP